MMLTGLEKQIKHVRRHETAVLRGHDRCYAHRVYCRVRTRRGVRWNGSYDRWGESPQICGGLSEVVPGRWAWTGSSWQSE